MEHPYTRAQIIKLGCTNPKPSFHSGKTEGKVATESVENTSVFKTSKMAIGGNGANNVFLPLAADRSGIQNPDTLNR